VAYVIDDPPVKESSIHVKSYKPRDSLLTLQALLS
jgi:hypothetical protein